MLQEKIIRAEKIKSRFFELKSQRQSLAFRRANFAVTGKRVMSLLLACAILATLMLPTLTRATAQQNQDVINVLGSFNIMATYIPPPPPNTNPNVIALPYDGPANRHPHAGTLDDINVVVPLVMDAAARKLKYYNQPSSPQHLQAELKAVSSDKEAWFKFAPFMLQVGWESVMATNPTLAQQAMYKYFQRYYGIQNKFIAQYTLLQWYRYSKEHAAKLSPMQMLINTGPDSQTFRDQLENLMGIQRDGTAAIDRLLSPAAIAEYASELPEFADDPDIPAGQEMNKFLLGMGFGAGTGSAALATLIGVAVIPAEANILAATAVKNAGMAQAELTNAGKVNLNAAKLTRFQKKLFLKHWDTAKWGEFTDDVLKKVTDQFGQKLTDAIKDRFAGKVTKEVIEEVQAKVTAKFGEKIGAILGKRLATLGKLATNLSGPIAVLALAFEILGTKIAEMVAKSNFIDGLKKNITQPNYNLDIRSKVLKMKAPERYYRGQTAMGCPPGQVADAGLCYPACGPNERGIATICYTNCPANLRDDGLYCGKPGEYGRGGGYPAWDWDRCEREQGKGNCEWWGAMIYPKCKAGYAPFGCCLCKPACPPGWEDIGVSCKKPARSRGIGTPLNSCPAGYERQGALCYPLCKPGYDGRLDWCYPNASAVAERLPDDDDVKANKISFFSWMVKMMIADPVDGLPFGQILQLSLALNEQDFDIPGYPLTLAEQGFGRSATNPSQPTTPPATRPGQPTTQLTPRPNVGVTPPREALLDKGAVENLLDDLAASLDALIRDETVLGAIESKWQKLTLVGKTKKQAVDLLFAEVKSLVNDDQTLDSVWRRWRRHTEGRLRP